MARKQLGAAPAGATDAATKGYVDGRVLTDATNKYTFQPGSTPGTRRWTHLLTVDGKSAQGGGYANFLLSGTGDYGGANRGTLLIHAAQRGDNGFSVKAWGWNITSTNAPVELYSVQVAPLIFQVWARLAPYNQAHELHLLGQNNATIVLASQDATPTPTVAYSIVHMDEMSPVTHGHALTDANITGVLPLAQLPVASSGTSSSTSIVRADDTRLSNARTPTAHTHTLTDLPDAWVKRSVRVATTANITLSGTQTVDGVALAVADRVLVKNQTTTSQNGIYAVATGAWTRSTGTDTASELAGATVNVDQGGQAGQLWTNNFPSTGVVGTTAVTWSRVLDTSLLAASGGTTAGTVVQANDSRLSDARTPTTHGHALTDANVTGILPVAKGGTGRITANTPYGLLAAGTSANGIQQTIAPGGAGQALISKGVSQLAAFETLTKTHVGLSNVDNTSDANKPISTAQASAINEAGYLAKNLAAHVVKVHYPNEGAVVGMQSGVATLTTPTGSATASLSLYGGTCFLPSDTVDGLRAFSGSAFTITRPATLSRIDAIFLGLDTGAPAWAYSSVRVLHVQGTPSATPVAPSAPANSPTGQGHVLLHTILVPSATAQPIVVTDVRPFGSLVGGVISVPDAAARARVVRGIVGSDSALVHQSDTDELWIHGPYGWQLVWRYRPRALPVVAHNLDNYNWAEHSGDWYQETNAGAAAGSNYPEPYAGLLTVKSIDWTNERYVYQDYYVYGGAAGSLGRRYFRSKYAFQAWTPWRAVGGEQTRLGTVDPYYTQGPPKVTWDGEAALSGPHAYQGDWVPRGGQRILGTWNAALNQWVVSPVSTGPNGLARWHNLPLSNNWKNYGSGYSTAQFTKTASGIVKVKGLISSGTAVAGTVIGVLPVGFRPAQAIMLAVQRNGVGAASAGSVDVMSDGTIVARAVEPGWTSLENITFPAADAAPTVSWTNMTLANSFTVHGDPVWAKPSYWKDPHGIVWQRGVAARTSTPTTNTMPITTALPVGFRPEKSMHRRTTASNVFAFIYALQSGEVGWGNGSGGAGYLSLDGVPFAATTSPLTWNPLTLLNGWANFDLATYSAASYAITPDGLVLLRGLIRLGTPGAAPFANLPPGARPSATVLVGAVSNAAPARIDIGAGGDMLPLEASVSWLSLDGICLVAEQ